jgi:hypothetical protein
MVVRTAEFVNISFISFGEERETQLQRGTVGARI